MSKKASSPRKYVSESKQYSFNDLSWRVKGEGGLDVRNLNRVFQQVDVMLYKYSKVCVIRFDLHPFEYSPKNTDITTFRRKLFKRLKSKYGITPSNSSYFCKREHESSKGQHYHWALIVDGKKIRHVDISFGIGEIISSAYELIGNVHFSGYRNVKRSDLLEQKKTMCWLSYLTKIRGKGYAGKNTYHFSSSKTCYPDGEINTSCRKGLFSRERLNND